MAAAKNKQAEPRRKMAKKKDEQAAPAQSSSMAMAGLNLADEEDEAEENAIELEGLGDDAADDDDNAAVNSKMAESLAEDDFEPRPSRSRFDSADWGGLGGGAAASAPPPRRASARLAADGSVAVPAGGTARVRIATSTRPSPETAAWIRRHPSELSLDRLRALWASACADSGLELVAAEVLVATDGTVQVEVTLRNAAGRPETTFSPAAARRFLAGISLRGGTILSLASLSTL